jgi:copper chaperone CopZ
MNSEFFRVEGMTCAIGNANDNEELSALDAVQTAKVAFDKPPKLPKIDTVREANRLKTYAWL